MRVSYDTLDRKIHDVKEKIRDLEVDLKTYKIYRIWESEFGSKTKLGSRDQLSHILFNKMNFTGVKYEAEDRKSRHRDYKMDRASLEHIDHPFVKEWDSYCRHNTTLKTFLLSPKKHIIENADGFYYIHPNFNLNTVSTYRSSCNSPNLMNIPVRDEEQAEFARDIYLPHHNEHFVDIDISQAEVRAATCYHHDETMISYLSGNGDMHEDMAMEIYMLERHEVSKVARYSAKNKFVFPSFYGSTYFQCALNLWKAIEQLGITIKDTTISLLEHLKKKGIKSRGDCIPRKDTVPGTFEHHINKVENKFWNKRFATYTKWKNDWWAKYQRTAGFRMLTGFYVYGLFSRNEVINYPIQGPAFHWLLWSLNEIQKHIWKYKWKTKLISEVHDSCLASSPPNEINDFLDVATEIMTVKLRKKFPWINVPVVVEPEVAPLNKAWSKKEKWERKSSGGWGAKA